MMQQKTGGWVARFVVVVIVALGIVQMADAANVNFTVNPAFEQEYITGSPPAIGAGRTDVVRDDLGESRGVWEFGLPAMAPGYTLNSAAVKSYVSALQGSTTVNADVNFHGYAGNGVFNGAGDGTVPFNQVARTGPMLTGGARLDPLNVAYLQSRYAAGSTHIGLMGYAEVAGYRTGFSNAGQLGPTQLTVNATVPDTGTVVSRPVVDAKVSTSDMVNYVLTDGEGTINTQYLPGANVDRRGILEYHLGGVPDGATITAAKIAFNLQAITYSGSDGPNVRLYGYSGNGLAELSDKDQMFNLLAVGSSTTSTGPYEVDLSTTLIESLLSSGTDYLGIVALGSADGHQLGFYTNEAGFSPPATLSVTYAIPEPAAMSLLLAPLAMFMRRRRR
ncbi:MAG: hypothetical protein QOF78_1625 [Phycisphaerales bacterium]|nr:hypothetical protein [Phycisphaerales bacterium]